MIDLNYTIINIISPLKGKRIAYVIYRNSPHRSRIRSHLIGQENGPGACQGYGASVMILRMRCLTWSEHELMKKAFHRLSLKDRLSDDPVGFDVWSHPLPQRELDEPITKVGIQVASGWTRDLIKLIYHHHH